MRQNLILVLFLSFAGVATVVSATSPFSMSLTTNTLYQNTNTTPLSIYSMTHSAPLTGYLGTAPSANLLYAFPITLTNAQSPSTPSPFQQMVNLSESNPTYGSYIAYSGSTADFEYEYANATVIPAWIESNSSGKIITWLKLTPSIAGSGGTLKIYLVFASKSTNLLSSSGTTGIGEAPQLSPTYAEYDDGATVFPLLYQNFAGSITPSGWTAYGSPVFNNGVTVTFTSGTTQWVLTSASYAPSSNILDVYGNQNDGGTNCALGNCGFGFIDYPNDANPLGFISAGTGYNIEDMAYATTGTQTIAANGQNHIFSMSYTASGDGTFSYDYGAQQSLTGGGITGSVPISAAFEWRNAGAGTVFTQWIRLRAAPPANVMPSTSFGSEQSPPVAQLTMQEVIDETGGSVTISSIVYSLAGYNMSGYMHVQPQEYYKFNFTSANFVGQYQPTQASQLYSAGNGLSLNGNVFSVNAVAPLVANAEGISLAYTGNIFVTSQGQLDAIAGSSSSSINTIYLIQGIPFIRGD